MSKNDCEDDEMGLYRKSSLNVVTFRIVRQNSDLESTNKSNSFKPEMAHQIFGETEMIFGYRQLKIDLYYLHNSAKCYVDIYSNGKIQDTDLYKADDVMKALNSWLPENYTTDREVFVKNLKAEEHDVIHGKTIQSFDTQKKSYKVTLCNLTDEKFKEFHQRFETFIVWFIDGANYIDLDDSRWLLFYVYEEHIDEKSGKTCYSPVGFCTVYKFFLYPNSIRPRISQFFVLPTHQKRGIGTNFYSIIFNHLREMPETQDITVEEPTQVFQNIRDFSDSLYIYKSLGSNGIRNQNPAQINQVLKKSKVGKKQARRVFDILECLATFDKGKLEYDKFKEAITQRISEEIEKETRGSKRLCNMERVGVALDSIDKKVMAETECTRYIESLQRPVNRLRSHLAQMN